MVDKLRLMLCGGQAAFDVMHGFYMQSFIEELNDDKTNISGMLINNIHFFAFCCCCTINF